MGMPITYFNGSPEIDTWYYNGTDLLRAYFNNVLVFEKPLYLTLPCNPNYTSLNLRTFINDRNPNNLVKVIITLPSGCHHPTIYSGNLNGLYVFLKIESNAYLEAGTYNAPAALSLSSDMWLENNGEIRGYGGKGGKGGRGHKGDDYSTGGNTCSGYEYDGDHYWYASCTDCINSSNTTVTFKFGSYSGQLSGCTTCDGASHYSYGGADYYKGSHQSGNATCDGNTHSYWSIRRCHDTTQNYSGGNGGEGGEGGPGQWYKHGWENGKPGHAGDPGGHPEDTRGYTGGQGGHGGSWGAQGERGHRGEGNGSYGAYGAAGGKSITGSSHLQSGSSTGTTRGDVT
jgi:hypothetical protein